MDTGCCALSACQLLIHYCSVPVDIICVAVERSRKETVMPSEFQSCYHHVEDRQLSCEVTELAGLDLVAWYFWNIKLKTNKLLNRGGEK